MRLCGFKSRPRHHLKRPSGQFPDHQGRRRQGDVAKWLRRRSAKPLCGGSNPPVASNSPPFPTAPFTFTVLSCQPGLAPFLTCSSCRTGALCGYGRIPVPGEWPPCPPLCYPISDKHTLAPSATLSPKHSFGMTKSQSLSQPRSLLWPYLPERLHRARLPLPIDTRSSHTNPPGEKASLAARLPGQIALDPAPLLFIVIEVDEPVEQLGLLPRPPQVIPKGQAT